MKFYNHGIFSILYFLSVMISRLNANDDGNFSKNNALFTLDLFDETIKSISDKNDNIIISPLSIQTCLALAFMGAGGNTAEELSNGLRLDTTEKSTVAKSFKNILNLNLNNNDNVKNSVNSLVTIANKIYAQNDIDIKNEFRDIAKNDFDSYVENVDFEKNIETAKSINDWIENKTNKKIQNLIEPETLNNAKVLMINAIYFRGIWQKQFISLATLKSKFWLNDKDSIETDMMYVDDDFLYGELKNLNSVAIQLPYNNSDLRMLVIVPNDKSGIKNLEMNLKSINLNDIENKLESNEVSLQFPKFKNEFSVQLNDILIKMGMQQMFTNGADFSHLTSTKIKVDQVFHKAVIEVDEVGTEAAAATYLKAVALSANLNKKYLSVNRPFLYFIKDSNAVYFMGRVSKF